MADKSTSTNNARTGLRLTGRLVNVTSTVYRESYSGNKDGRPFTIPAHYEQTLAVVATDTIYQAVVRYDDPLPGHEAAHKTTYNEGDSVDLPVQGTGKHSQGIWTIYIQG